ncbi:hypothetical protein [Peribacillus glennii]|nr:hypothetical protein [Peribacillus glennii]
MIGHGFNRIVYNLANGYVLKIALSDIGLLSNYREFELFHNSDLNIRQYLCPVLEAGEGWVVMQKIDRKVPMRMRNVRSLSDLTMKFLMNRIVPVDLRLGNVAFTHDHQMVVIDYGLFIKV